MEKGYIKVLNVSNLIERFVCGDIGFLGFKMVFFF